METLQEIVSGWNRAAPRASDHAPKLASILAAAPVGIEVVGPNGRRVFSSAMAEDATHPHMRCFEIELDGEAYSLALTLDESERQAYEHDLIQRAYFDELTGLPNRSLFERSISSLIKDGPADFALALIDVDGFKHVNDYYGHATGDRLLTRIAERLSVGLRSSDMLARLSGDEFVLLISPIANWE